MSSKRSTRRGFSLIETMVSLVIIAFGVTAALGALLAAAKSAREGQYRQFKTALAEAAGSRYRLMDKTLLATMVVATPPSLTAGIGGWPADPSTPQLGDLSTGAYFSVDPQGQITPLAVPLGTLCNSATIVSVAKASCQSANGTACTAFCREVVLLNGLPGAQCLGAKGSLNDCSWWAGTAGATATLAAGAVAYTVYVRVFTIPLNGTPIDSNATVQRSETFIQ